MQPYSAVATIESEMPVAVRARPRRYGRLLVVEDAICMQRILATILDKVDLVAEMAENGKVACEMAEQSRTEGHPYDLILMDTQMPKLDGCEATKWLRKHGWEGPIVAVSALEAIEDRERCLKAGCNEHVCKPVAEERLHEVCQRFLDPNWQENEASARSKGVASVLGIERTTALL